MIYRIEHKSDALTKLGRNSVLLQKVGCPVGCCEYLPIDDAVFQSVDEGDFIEITIRKV